jgi:hypothetical protein
MGASGTQIHPWRRHKPHSTPSVILCRRASAPRTEPPRSEDFSSTGLHRPFPVVLGLQIGLTKPHLRHQPIFPTDEDDEYHATAAILSLFAPFAANNFLPFVPDQPSRHPCYAECSHAIATKAIVVITRF